MLHILLLILKIIGIVLAALLGVILLVLLCVLFVPVRYRIEAEGKLGREQAVRAGVKVSWLLHLINAAFTYPDAACIRVRLLCFTIFDSSKGKKTEGKKKAEEKKNGKKKEKEQKKRKRQKEQKGQPLEAETTQQPAGTKEEPIEKTGLEKTGLEEKRIEENEIKEKGIEKKGIKENENEIEEKRIEEKGIEEEAKNIQEKVREFFQAVRRIFYQFLDALKNIEYTIGKICDKIKKIMESIRENIRYYTEVLKSEAFRGAWAVSRKQLLRVFRMLRPRVFRVNLLAGTGDSAGAGQLLAFYGILYPFIGNNVSVEADFENKVMEGNVLMKGRVRVFVFLLAAFQLFVNKNIRRLWKMLKKEDM